jgi:hypothetical protein
VSSCYRSRIAITLEFSLTTPLGSRNFLAALDFRATALPDRRIHTNTACSTATSHLPLSKAPKTRIVSGDHYADILIRYADDAPPVYYWICQKQDIAEILGMGSTASFEEAEQAARECLDRLVGGTPCDVEMRDPLRFRIN